MSRGGKRPGSGRKKQAPELAALKGTARKDRDKAKGSDVAPAGVMICPAHLGDLEQLYFGSIAKLLTEQSRASHHFTEIVAMLAVRLAQIERYKAVLECDGDTFETATATGALMIRKHPAVQMLSDAMRHAQSLLGELMLTPSAAQRIADGAKRTSNPFDDL